MRVGTHYRFNIINCEKSNSQFNYGEAHPQNHQAHFSNQKPDCVFVRVVFRHAAADVLGAGGHQRQASLGPNRNRHLLLQVGLYIGSL